MTVDLYHHEISAPSHAVRLAAAAFSVDVNLKRVDLFQGEQMKPEFLKLNPQHTIPVLVDNGFVVTESRATLQYLGNAYSKPNTESLYPKDPKARALVDQRLLFDMGTLYSAFSGAYYPKMFYQKEVLPENVAKLDDALGYLNGFLEKTKYVAGDHLTIADFTLVASISKIEAVNHDLKKYPAIVAYFTKCKKEMKNYDECCGEGTKAFGAMAKSALGF